MKQLTPLLMIPSLFFFWLGWSFGPSEEKVVEKVIEKEVEKKVFINEGLKETDHTLEDLKKREQVAKAYYERAFALFLANVGHKLSQSQKGELDRLINNPQEYLARAPRPPKTSENSKDAPELIDSSSLFENPNADSSSLEALPEDIKVKATRHRLKDPGGTYAKSQYVQDISALKRYLGEYKGELFVTNGNKAGEVHQVYMNVDFSTKEDSTIDGSFQLQLFNGEKVYSDNRGSGGNRDVRMLDEHLIIDVGPGWFFMFPYGELSLGHYYQEGSHQGIVRLQRN